MIVYYYDMSCGKDILEINLHPRWAATAHYPAGFFILAHTKRRVHGSSVKLLSYENGELAQ
jgi:hypothetical protein